MTPFFVLSIQFTLSLVAFGLIARWYVAPRLAALPKQQALEPLLWVHVFRYIPLTLYAPGQADPSIPPDVIQVIAYGDFISGLLALVALVALRLRASFAILLVWTFNVVSVGDLIASLFKAIGAQMYQFPIGLSWLTVNVYVPLLIVTQVMLVYYSARR